MTPFMFRAGKSIGTESLVVDGDWVKKGKNSEI